MVAVDVRPVKEWSDAAFHHSQMVSSYWSVSTSLLKQSTRLTEVDGALAFMILQSVWLYQVSVMVVIVLISV